jgi:hypothetical protein
MTAFATSVALRSGATEKAPAFRPGKSGSKKPGLQPRAFLSAFRDPLSAAFLSSVPCAL